jgi:hypothetical protein
MCEYANAAFQVSQAFVRLQATRIYIYLYIIYIYIERERERERARAHAHLEALGCIPADVRGCDCVSTAADCALECGCNGLINAMDRSSSPSPSPSSSLWNASDWESFPFDPRRISFRALDIADALITRVKRASTTYNKQQARH